MPRFLSDGNHRQRHALARGRVLLPALALALLTEGLQFLAIDRHPRWIAVGIDMAGVWAGGCQRLGAFLL